jgi:hypothetical protein
MRSGDLWRVTRREVFEGRRPEPPGRFVGVATVIAAATMVGYVGQKVYMAWIGKIGMPGKYAPQSVQESFDHPALAQAGNAFLALLSVLLVLATVMRWGGGIPRLPLLGALLVALGMLSLGAATSIRRNGLDLTDPTWSAAFDVVLGLAQIGAWFVVVGSYAVRSRRPRADRAAEVAG